MARSFVPGNRCPVDKTIEETFMKHSISHGGGSAGFSGLLSNYDTYQRWVQAAHEIVQFVILSLSLFILSVMAVPHVLECYVRFLLIVACPCLYLFCL